MAGRRSMYRYGWHPDRPWDGTRRAASGGDEPSWAWEELALLKEAPRPPGAQPVVVHEWRTACSECEWEAGAGTWVEAAALWLDHPCIALTDVVPEGPWATTVWYGDDDVDISATTSVEERRALLWRYGALCPCGWGVGGDMSSFQANKAVNAHVCDYSLASEGLPYKHYVEVLVIDKKTAALMRLAGRWMACCRCGWKSPGSGHQRAEEAAARHRRDTAGDV